MATEPMGKRTMKIVVGYVPLVDRLPNEPRKLGLNHRVAFVLDTFHADKVDMYFDEEPYAALVVAVREALSTERMFSELASGEPFEITNAK